MALEAGISWRECLDIYEEAQELVYNSVLRNACSNFGINYDELPGDDLEKSARALRIAAQVLRPDLKPDNK